MDFVTVTAPLVRTGCILGEGYLLQLYLVMRFISLLIQARFGTLRHPPCILWTLKRERSLHITLMFDGYERE